MERTNFKEISLREEHRREIEKIISHSFRFESVEDYVVFMMQSYLRMFDLSGEALTEDAHQ